MNEKTFIKDYHTYQKHLWENLIDGASHDLKKDDAILYNHLSQSKKKKPFILQGRIEHHPDVSILLRKLEAFERYDTPAQGLDHARMSQDILKLMKKRDQLAKLHNFESYKAMHMDFDDVKEINIKTMLAVLIKKEEKKRQKLIRKYRITYDNFFKKLKMIGPRPKHDDATLIIDKVKRKLQLGSFDKHLKLSISKDHISGYCQKVGKNDIRLASHPIVSMAQLKTFLHELSHAIIKVYQDDDTMTQFMRPQKFEILACVVEQILIDSVCTVTERRHLNNIQVLENARLGISALFEFDLHDKRAEPEKLFESLVRDVFPLDDPKLWVVDSFRTTDALCAQYYPLGHVAALNLRSIRKLEKIKRKQLGSWLETNILGRINEIDPATLL